jgi:hypothetical protein
MVTAVPLTDQGLDLLVQDLPGQKASHLGMMLKKLELHVDGLIQQVVNRFRNWRLFGIAAMLRHLERGSFLGDALSRITGEEPLLCFESQLSLNIGQAKEYHAPALCL